MRPTGPLLFMVTVAMLLPSVPARAQVYTEGDRREERAQVDSIQAELLPRVCRLMELEGCVPIPVQVWTRMEMGRRIGERKEATFPRDEWLKMGRCLAEIGLVRRGVDLQMEFFALLVSQAGAGYDPWLGRYVSLLDVPASMKTGALRRMVIAHELTHAMQDREADMEALHYADLTNLDRYFARRAIFEGMASVVMYSVAQDLPLDELPDIAAFMRERFAGNRDDFGHGVSGPPPLLEHFLFAPYVEGSAFVQRALRASPEISLHSLLDSMPVTEEQILHPAKYLRGERPTPIDLSPMTERIPAHWEPYHRNELGERDVRLLLTLNGSPRVEADRAASGWDGFSIAGFTDRDESLALIGVSVWDTPEDAADFAPLFRRVLSSLHGEEAFRLRVDGRRVSFTIGFESELMERLAQAR